MTCCMCFNIKNEGFHSSALLFGVGAYISALEHCRKMKCSTFCGVLYSLYTGGSISQIWNIMGKFKFSVYIHLTQTHFLNIVTLE